MANRTLRRAYSGNEGSEKDTTLSEGRGTNPAEGSDEPTTNDESTVVVNGTDDERDTNSVSSIGAVEIDPANIGEFIENGGSDGNGTRKRRKRSDAGVKRGTGTGRGRKKAEETVAPFIMMVHAFMATKVPEMALEDDEAQKLSDAYANFCNHHDIPVLSDKRLSEINLIIALGSVYGTRLFAIRNRLRDEKAEKKAKNVEPIFAPQMAVMQ